MPLSKDLREFVECLNSNGVEYLIVGALAVSWHGYPRYSADVDLFVNASPPNAIRVLAAIQQFGFGSLGLTADDFTAPARVIQLGHEPNRIDLMTSISGVGFEDALAKPGGRRTGRDPGQLHRPRGTVAQPGRGGPWQRPN